MIKDCIILCGGLGTRLKSEVPNLPKPMAPVADRPFLWYVVKNFIAQGVEHFVFALGYKNEIIQQYLASSESPFVKEKATYTLSLEQEPLGTGGAIHKACSLAQSEDVIIANGDTFYKVDLAALSEAHDSKHAECTLSLKTMHEFDRYGVVALDADNQVVSFKEKKFYIEGLINGGIYALNIAKFQSQNWPEKFSFETDYLEKNTNNGKLFGVIDEHFFIDIGIPEDYKKAMKELKIHHFASLDIAKIDKTWTLFLDRDGVLNEEIGDSYVLSTEQLKVYDYVPKALGILAKKFNTIVIATNQKGIGKKLMTIQELTLIHKKLKAEIATEGGRIDSFYFCPDLEDNSPNRKPQPGMAFQAKKDYPNIEFSKSIMVGNRLSDMKFGRNAGMFTVLLSTTHPDIPYPNEDTDLRFPDLLAFAQALEG